jgi:predicted glutamine amidotransferase
MQMTVATTDGESFYGFRYSSAGRSRSLFHSNDVSTLREQYPDNPLLSMVADAARLVVSEPLWDLRGAWREVPESTCIVIRHGRRSCTPSHRPRLATG